jgi:hypothetical protein
MTNKRPISSKFTLLSRPSIAFLANLMSTISMGMITGKLKMAISIPPLPALAAIAATMVNMVAKLKLPKIVAIKYIKISVAGGKLKTKE